MNLYRDEGNLPDTLLPTARGQIPFPLKFGYQEVGEMVAAAADSGYSVGDRVLCASTSRYRGSGSWVR